MSPMWADDDEALIAFLTGRYQRDVPELFAPVSPFEVPSVRQWAARRRRARRARVVLLLVVLVVIVVVLSWPD